MNNGKLIAFRRCGERGKLMSRRKKPIRREIVLYGLLVGLGLTLSGCGGDFVKDFLCRPDGHCVDAPDRNTNSEA
jgi:hypothetical protein